MTVKLLLSQPAGGKTTFCVNKIKEIRKKEPFAPVKVIVPNRMQMAYWKQALAQNSLRSGQRGGFIGTEVISFSKLAIEILSKSPHTPQLIPAHLDSLCVKEAIRNASRDQPFRYFEPICKKPGTAAVFEHTIRSLLHSCITPEMLADAATDDPKVADTVLVFREYLDILKKNNWIGSAGHLALAADHLIKNFSAFPHCPLLVVDGFDELTQDNLNFLSALTSSCDEILITLPANRDSSNPTDLRIMKNADIICSSLNAEYINPQKFCQKSQIQQLADSVFYPSINPGNIEAPQIPISDNELMMIEASSRTTEVREALRELKRRIIISEKSPESRIFPSDCAIFVPDMTAYAPILRQFGREMGIPLRFSQKQSLTESPAASALKRLLHLYPDFETMKVLSVLRLPFFSGCMDPNDSSGNYGADLFVIDRIGRKMNIISGTEEWQSAFSEAKKSALRNIHSDTDSDESPDEGKVYEYPPTEKLDRIYYSFDSLTKYLTPPSGLLSRREWTNWLGNLLDTIHFYEQITDPTGRSFESDFRNLLKRIVFCEDKLKQSAISYETFLHELESEMDTSAQTEQEFAADRIFVGDISQSCGCRWKLIILTGFAEGIFPRAEHEDLILTNNLKQKLGIPLPTDQQLLFHHSITRSDTGLVITRPQKTDKGEEWPASIFWQTIRENLAENANLRTVTENMPVTAASPEEFAFRLARSGKTKISDEMQIPNSNKYQLLLDRAQTGMQLLQMQSNGKYSPEVYPELKEVIADPIKDVVPYSCSAIETWLTCPFKYFLMKKLRLEQQQEPSTGMDAAQIGTLNHAVMELTFVPGTVYSSKEEALERADKAIDKVFATAPQDFGFKESELWKFEKEKYRQKLLDSIKRMFDLRKTDMPMTSDWKSVGTEMEFGYPGKGEYNSDPLTIETTAGPIQIRGIIDRVDCRDDGLLRVVDYKTGSPGFTPEELEAGSHIQAGVYAAAVVHALKMGPKCEGMYWSINYKSIKEYMLYDSEKDQSVPKLEFLNKFAEGIRDASYPAEPAGGTCPDYCPSASWCRRYVKRVFYG